MSGRSFCMNEKKNRRILYLNEMRKVFKILLWFEHTNGCKKKQEQIKINIHFIQSN